MPYATRLIREARAAAEEEQADADFVERLLEALADESDVHSAIRALTPAGSSAPAKKKAAPRPSRR